MQVVNNISSKLDLSSSLERVESIDANHMEMVRCVKRSDESYRAIFGVLKQFLKSEEINADADRSRRVVPVESSLQV